MPAIFPPHLPEHPCHESLVKAGLVRIYRGKVRSTYRLKNGLLLQVASDGISIFDLILNALVPFKGAVLMAMTIEWLTGVFKDYPSHLVAFGRDIDHYLPPAARGNPELHRRAIVVEELEIFPAECVVRGYLTGSGWKEYKISQSVCGIPLPAGLFDGAELPEPIFTPTTKAESGHDKPLTFEQFQHLVGREVAFTLREESLQRYTQGREAARKKGIIVADTKFEFGRRRSAPRRPIIADEFLTPDSCRFWILLQWLEYVKQRKSPPSRDKQVVRNWGKTVDTPWGMGLDNDNIDPQNPEHCAFVHSLTVPEHILTDTTQIYLDIFQQLVGVSLETFQRQTMRIAA
jgi:phosphoribosylaminoimidazole-succinocarboxamide synthase